MYPDPNCVFIGSLVASFPGSCTGRKQSLNKVQSCAMVDKAPLVAKIAQEVGWEVVWDAALSRGGQSIRRMQLLVKACPDDPLACPYVDGHDHLCGETLRQLEHSNFQLLFSVVCILYVSLGLCNETLNFEL